MWLIVYVCCIEKGLKACWIIVDVTSCLCGCELCDVMKIIISSFFLCELVICIILRHWLWQVLCALRKNGYLRGCTISREVSRAAMDTIFRGTYRAPRWLLLSRIVSCAVTEAWTDISPMSPGLRDSGCVSLGQTCIIILDIALHILIIGELDIVFCWSCDCLSAEFVIDNTELVTEDM